MGQILSAKQPKVKALAAGGAARSRAPLMATKNWIAGAIKQPGALRQQLGTAKGKNIPAGKLAAAAKAPGKLGQRARLAQTLKGFK